MSYIPYEFPDFGNAATRQQVNALIDANRTTITSYKSNAGVAQNASANVYAPSGTIAPYGSDVFGLDNGYNVMPGLISQDSTHREISLKIQEPLLFRRNLGVPDRDARGYRTLTTTINAPQTSARFRGDLRGDVYGS